MQKFTRPVTREIEVAGERLALTFSEAGIRLRPVGSRKPPWEMTWPAVLCHLTAPAVMAGHSPTAEQVAAAVESLKKGTAPPAAKTAPAAEQAPAAAPEEQEAADDRPGPVM